MAWFQNYFLNESTRALPAFDGQYEPVYVIISVLIAVSASFFSIELAVRFALRGYRRIWLPFAALVLGIGIWSMHFIGIMAIGWNAAPAMSPG